MSDPQQQTVCTWHTELAALGYERTRVENLTTLMGTEILDWYTRPGCPTVLLLIHPDGERELFSHADFKSIKREARKPVQLSLFG